MNTSFRLIRITILFVIAIGCNSTQTQVAIPANIEEISLLKAQNLVQRMVENDYADFVADFDETMQKAITEQAFIEIRNLLWRQLGNFQSIQY